MRVAIVDDQPDIAYLIEVQLSFVEDVEVVVTLADYTAATSYDGWPDVDACTVDWMLPGVRDGVALVDWLAEHHPHVRAVVVTAAPESMQDAHPEFHGTVLPKPYDVRDLVAALKGEWRPDGAGA